MIVLADEPGLIDYSALNPVIEHAAVLIIMIRIQAILCVVLCLLAAGAVSAADFTPYIFAKPVDAPRSAVGLRLQAGVLELAGDVTAEALGSRTRVAPKLSTNLALAPNLSMETRVDFAEWNGRTSLFDERAIETKIRVRAPLPLVREIESSFWQGQDGLLRQRLGVGLVENLGLSLDASGRFKLNTQAVFEQTVRDGETAGLVSGLRFTLSGFATDAGTVENRLSFRYESREGESTRRTGVVTYHRGWRVNDMLRLSLDCAVVSAIEIERKILLGWHASF